MSDYKTIEDMATAEFVEKKSRFIGHIKPVKTEVEAQAFISEISKKHFDATHNVYAYILRDGQIKRYSDNGEPQGTAGIPTLDVLQKEGLVDVCVVVTRYFGGTMLGAGGLVRAYSHAASIAVHAARILNMTTCCIVSITCEYTMHGKLLYIFPQYNIKLQESNFSSLVEMKLQIRKDRLSEFTKAVTDLSNGQLVPYVLEEIFADME